MYFDKYVLIIQLIWCIEFYIYNRVGVSSFIYTTELVYRVLYIQPSWCIEFYMGM